MLIEKNVMPLFSAPVYTAHVENYENDVLDFDNIDSSVYDVFDRTDNMLSKNQNILLEPEFAEIKHHVDTAMKDYTYKVLQIDPELKLKLVCSWAVVGGPNSMTPKHIHQNSIFSGTFYIKSEQGAGDLILTTPKSSTTFLPPAISPKMTGINIFNTKTWHITPRTGDIVIFPSHVFHEVSPNKSGENRSCIAFNYYLTGPISDHETETLFL